MDIETLEAVQRVADFAEAHCTNFVYNITVEEAKNIQEDITLIKSYLDSE